MSAPDRYARAVGAGLLSALLLTTGITIAMTAPRGAFALALSGLVSSTGLACIALCGALLSPDALRTTLGLRRPAASTGRIVLYALGLIGLSTCVDGALAQSGLRETSVLPELDGLIAGASPLGLGALLLGVALAPAVGEELLFRGWLLGAFERLTGTAWSVAITTLLFGLLHLDPVHATGATALGLYLAAVRLATGSTVAAIVCHLTNNAIAIGFAARGGPPLDVAIPLAVLLATAATAMLWSSLRMRARSGQLGAGQAPE